MNLDQYLDYNLIKITGKDGVSETGTPISVCYEDETPTGEQMIDIEDDEGISGFYESEIEKVEIIA